MAKKWGNWQKVGKSGEKWEKVVKSCKKWGKVEKVGKSGEKWGKVGISVERWLKVAKKKWLKVFVTWRSGYKGCL